MCTAQCREVLCVYCKMCRGTECVLHCLKRPCCHNTDYVHINGHDRTNTVILAKHCIKLPDDGSFVIRNMLGNFKYFIIVLILSRNYIIVHLLIIKCFICH